MTRQIPSSVSQSRRTGSNEERSLVVPAHAVKPYDADWVVPTALDTPPVTIYTPGPAELSDQGIWARALQSILLQQSMLLRSFDLRLRHLETKNRETDRNAYFEHMTWWMLWGMLMLITGAALTVILVLIFYSFLR